MTEHLRFLSSAEWGRVKASLRQAAKSGEIWTDPKYRAVADHINGIHSADVGISAYHPLLIQHHAAFLSGEIKLEDLTIPVL